MTKNFIGFEYDYEKYFDNFCGSFIKLRIIPVKVGIGFDWYNPHLYNHFRGIILFLS